MRRPAAALCLALGACCANAPRESASWIRDARESHAALLARYFDERRSAADDLLRDRWIPRFMRDFAETSGIDRLLAAAPDQESFLALLTGFAQAAAFEIAARRRALLGALGRIERALAARIHAHYDEMAGLRPPGVPPVERRLPLPMDRIEAGIARLVSHAGDADEYARIADALIRSLSESN
jgi:hypothetical protein